MHEDVAWHLGLRQGQDDSGQDSLGLELRLEPVRQSVRSRGRVYVLRGKVRGKVRVSAAALTCGMEGRSPRGSENAISALAPACTT